MDKKEKPTVSNLRQMAEAKMQDLKDANGALSVDEACNLIHELRVHQIELEMQNEELRQAQLNLAESHAQYSNFYDLAPLGYLTLNEQGIILEANLTAAEQLGTYQSDLLKKPLSAYLPADGDKLYLHLRRVFQEKIRQTCELKVQSAPGREFYARLDSTFQKDLWGNDVCRAALIDISELKRAEEALRHSETKYRIVADNTYDWEFWLSPEGQFIYSSPSCSRITGFEAKEYLADNDLLTRIIHPDDRLLFKNHTRTSEKKKIPDELEFRVIGADGNTRWIEHICQPVYDIDGTYLGRRGSNRDITNRKKTEAEKLKLENHLRHLQKMEAIATLTDGIAHDFNNILATILGHVELTFLTLTEKTDLDQIRSSLREILHSVMRAQELVRQLLTFSGHLDEEKRPIEVHLIVSGTLNRLRALLPSFIEIRPHIYPDSGIVLAHPSQIHQVVMNLCTNAFHAMRDQGGILGVTLAAVDVDVDLAKTHPSLHEGPYIRLKVTDTGHGMGPWVMERIFEPYFTTKGPGEGTGLGLTSTYNIVSGLGGVITVNSEMGKGSMFQIYLPRLDRVLPTAFVQASPAPKGKGNILFVDDDQQIAQLGEMLLGHFGYQVTAFNSSQEALAVFRAQPDRFDLVITDLTMPQLNGIELAEELRRLQPNIEIIMCTGFSEVIAAQKISNLGIREVLIKPITADNLVKTINKVMAAKSALTL
jgi:PAS domain S-box-containing protein